MVLASESFFSPAFVQEEECIFEDLKLDLGEERQID
jgi:hypothetical protein